MFERRDNRVLVIFVVFYLLVIILLFAFGKPENVLGQSSLASVSDQEKAPSMIEWLTYNSINALEKATYGGNAIVKLDGPSTFTDGYISLGFRTSSQAIDETLKELKNQGRYSDRIKSSVESNYKLLAVGGEAVLFVRRTQEEAARGSNFVIRILDPESRTALKTYRLMPYIQNTSLMRVEDEMGAYFQFIGKVLINEKLAPPILIEVQDRFLNELHLYEVTPVTR